MSSHTSIQSRLLVATAAAAVFASTDLGRPPATPGAHPVQRLTIITTDFTFDAPDSIPAGLTRVRLQNKGREFHHAQIVRLRDGGSIQELLDTLGTDGKTVPAGTRYVGGPNVPAKDGWSEVTLTLRPGRYALICFVAGDDHVAHLQKGMTRLLTVTPTRETTASRTLTPEPTAEVRMTLHDFAFDMTPAISAGRRTVRVENAAAQPHEALLGRLAPGKSANDLLQWLSHREGPMPGEQIGGTTALSTGEVNFLTIDFAPGEYVLLCFVRDATDGKPHLAHGMIRQFRVEPATRTVAAPAPVAPATSVGSFSWPGVYDIVGTGFPEGERAAVMHIAQRDTGYSLVALQGPPGRLMSFNVVGDSAHVSWFLGGGTMVVDLRGSGDSLTGQWSSGELSGLIRGSRRR